MSSFSCLNLSRVNSRSTNTSHGSSSSSSLRRTKNSVTTRFQNSTAFNVSSTNNSDRRKRMVVMRRPRQNSFFNHAAGFNLRNSSKIKAASITPSDDFLNGQNPIESWLNKSEKIKTKHNEEFEIDLANDSDDDDDDFKLTKEDESIMNEMWLEICELLATFGTIGGGIAAIALGEVYLCSLVIVLPIVALGLRKKRETKIKEKTLERLRVLKEELIVVTRNKTTNATVMNLSNMLQKKNMVALEFAIQKAFREDGAFSIKFDSRLDALENAMKIAAEKQAASQRDSGAVAGMLARDVADARIDQRANFEKMYAELEEATKLSKTENERTRKQVGKELETLWELVENVEREISGVNDGISVRLSAILEQAEQAREERVKMEEERERSSSFNDVPITEFAFAEEFQSRVDEISKLADAVQRVKEAIDARNEAELGNELISIMDKGQWEALGLRFDALSEKAETTAERIVSEITESIEKNMFITIDNDGDGGSGGGAFAMANAVKMGANKIIAEKEKEEYISPLGSEAYNAINENKTGFERALRRSGSVEMIAETVVDRRPSSSNAENTTTSSSAMAFQQPSSSSSPTNDDSNSNNNNNNNKTAFNTSREAAAEEPPINARPGVTRESAYANMQAMLRSSEEEEEEEIFDPFAGIVAAPDSNSSSSNAIAPSAVSNEEIVTASKVDMKTGRNESIKVQILFDDKIASGLESLREGRKLAKSAEDDSMGATKSLENLIAAEECFASAVGDFLVAVESDPAAVSAKGNLGNALLARGVSLRALRDATAERVLGTSASIISGGLTEEDVRFYGESAEDALVDAGKYFRAVAVEGKKETSAVVVIVALIAWGRALSQRGALVRDDAEAFNLYDSDDEEDTSVIKSNLADSSKLFLAAAEKHRAAIEKCSSATQEDEEQVQARRIEAYCRWGEALESAAECEAILRSGKQLELWTAASGAYGESERLGEESGAASEGVERCEAKLE